MIGPHIPKELVNVILDYDGSVRYRNGQYIKMT